jgi:hypothetical protein
MARSKRSQQHQDESGNPLHPGEDDPCHAPESGNPDEAGRQQGHIIDPDGATPGMTCGDDAGGDIDFESGRHGTK